jgi:hypothetical protein
MWCPAIKPWTNYDVFWYIIRNVVNSVRNVNGFGSSKYAFVEFESHKAASQEIKNLLQPQFTKCGITVSWA